MPAADWPHFWQLVEGMFIFWMALAACLFVFSIIKSDGDE